MTSNMQARPNVIAVMGVIAVIAFTLRVGLTSVPSVLESIQESTGWSDVTLGALTTIPVLCMGVFALQVPRIARGIGTRAAVAMGLVLLAAGMALRALEAVPGVLFVAAFLVGIGIAVVSGLVPALVRAVIPTATGLGSGIWTAVMFAGAALGGALTPTFALWFGSWGLALAAWAIPAVIAAFLWWPTPTPQGASTATSPVRIREFPWRDRRAWALTLYSATNSIVFYSTVAWLAPSYVERGYSQAAAGGLFGVYIVGTIIAGLSLPWVSQHVRARRSLLAGTVIVATLMLVLIGFVPDVATLLVLAVFGFTLSGSFALVLALLSEYGNDSAGSTRLTAMVFFVTYVVAALGPLVIGALIAATDSWSLVYSVLALLCLAQVAFVLPLRHNVRIG
jgi:CP family cyanate transporter-like MFS transporter